MKEQKESPKQGKGLARVGKRGRGKNNDARKWKCFLG